MTRLMLMLSAALVLTACATGPGSLIGTVQGTKNLHTPEYAVKGRTPYDQRWINVTTEALVDGFGQPRPKPRPASLDAPARKKIVAAPAKTGTPLPTAKPKKKWWQKSAPTV